MKEREWHPDDEDALEDAWPSVTTVQVAAVADGGYRGPRNEREQRPPLPRGHVWLTSGAVEWLAAGPENAPYAKAHLTWCKWLEVSWKAGYDPRPVEAVERVVRRGAVRVWFDADVPVALSVCRTCIEDVSREPSW